MTADWMHICVELPPRDGAALLRTLRDQFGFVDTEWNLMQREDAAFADYQQIPAPMGADTDE